MAKTISTTDYRAATNMARIMVAVLYGLAGVLLGVSLRGLQHQGEKFVLGLAGAIVICNVVIWIYRKISLPKVQAQLDAAIASRDGPAFARQIIRREMTRMIQPAGGLAMTIGLLGTVIVLHQWY